MLWMDSQYPMDLYHILSLWYFSTNFYSYSHRGLIQLILFFDFLSLEADYNGVGALSPAIKNHMLPGTSLLEIRAIISLDLEVQHERFRSDPPQARRTPVQR